MKLLCLPFLLNQRYRLEFDDADRFIDVSHLCFGFLSFTPSLMSCFMIKDGITCLEYFDLSLSMHPGSLFLLSLSYDKKQESEITQENDFCFDK